MLFSFYGLRNKKIEYLPSGSNVVSFDHRIPSYRQSLGKMFFKNKSYSEKESGLNMASSARGGKIKV